MATRPEEYSELMGSFVAQEEVIKESLEKRANDVLKGISTIIALLLAVAALVVGDSEIGLQNWALGFLVAALLSFLVAGIWSLFVLVPKSHAAANYDHFDDLMTNEGYKTHWRDSDPGKANVVRFRIAEANLKFAKSARGVNETKAKQLIFATWMAFCGVIALGATLVVTLL